MTLLAFYKHHLWDTVILNSLSDYRHIYEYQIKVLVVKYSKWYSICTCYAKDTDIPADIALDYDINKLLKRRGQNITLPSHYVEHYCTL